MQNMDIVIESQPSSKSELSILEENQQLKNELRDAQLLNMELKNKIRQLENLNAALYVIFKEAGYS
jgi:hypothetical protein